jgi:hypothetical protein
MCKLSILVLSKKMFTDYCIRLGFGCLNKERKKENNAVTGRCVAKLGSAPACYGKAALWVIDKWATEAKKWPTL